MHRWMLAAALTVGGAIAGCAAPAINLHAPNTFLDSHDLTVMTNKMAVAIAADPVIVRLTEHGPMTIVLTRLKNETNDLIPPSEGDMFLQRMRVLLTAHAALRRRFVFVLNPATLRHLRQQQGLAATAWGPRQGGISPRYALQATFYADTHVAPKDRSDYYLCTFFLTNIQSGQVLWEGSYETKKMTHESFLY